MVIDTLILEADINKINGSCPPFDYSGPSCTEFIDKSIYHSNNLYFQDINTKRNDDFYTRANGNVQWILLISTSSNRYKGLSVVNFSFQPYPNTEMQLIDTLPIDIDKTTYQNMAHLQTTLDTSIHKSIYTNQWWAKDIGLIKFNTSDGNEWELKSYELKK